MAVKAVETRPHHASQSEGPQNDGSFSSYVEHHGRLERLERDALLGPMKQGHDLGGLQRVLIDERPRLLRFLRARGAGEDAEDVLHDLWQKVAVVPRHPVADPVTYLFRAAENLMRDRWRSEVSRERRQSDWHAISVPDHEAHPAERGLIACERLREAERTLAALGSRVDQVFRRCRLEGEGQAVIARELGISLSSVEKDLQKAARALAELRARFDAE